MSNDPKKGEGWDFIENQSDAWYDAFETYENQEGETHVDIDQYEHFDNIQELVNFVAGTGSYSDTRRFTPGQKDLEMKKREMMNDRWEIPEKLEQISEYLEQEDDIAPNEINLDPSAEVELKITESEATHRQGADTRYTMHFIAYNPDEQIQENEEPRTQFYLQGSWYDTPPEEMNLEQIFQSVMEQEK